MNIRGIILAGGLSRRMGKNKLELKINGVSIIERVINNAMGSKLEDILVVHGKYEVYTDLPRRYNPRFEEGMSTSIIEGLRDFNGDGIMVILGDMPFVSSEVINVLIQSFISSSKNIIVPTSQGIRGNPVIIGNKYFGDLLKNSGDKGARDIIKNHEEDVEFVELGDNSVLLDIDDEEALGKLNY